MKLTIGLLLINLFFLFSCKSTKKTKQIITVGTDEFPKLKIDSIRTDTTRVKQLLKEKLLKTQNDSIKIVIECNENAVFPDIKATAELIKKLILSYQGNSHVEVYNKCFVDFKLPNIDSTSSTAVIIRINADRQTSINNKIINIEAFCKEFQGKPITVTLKGDRGLGIEKIIPTYDRLKKENFMVMIKVDF